MEWKLFFTVFGTVFLAELGDKTQLATMTFAAKSDQAKMTVFLGASLALVLSTLIGVIAGAALSRYIDPKVLTYIAGSAFIVIGVWTLFTA